MSDAAEAATRRARRDPEHPVPLVAITWAYGAALVLLGESLFDHRKRWLLVAAAVALVMAGLWKLGKRWAGAQAVGA